MLQQAIQEEQGEGKGEAEGSVNVALLGQSVEGRVPMLTLHVVR